MPSIALSDMLSRMTTREGLSLKIRQQMLARNITQRDLARVIDLDPSGLSARLRGSRDFRVSELEAIAEALGMHLSELFTSEEER